MTEPLTPPPAPDSAPPLRAPGPQRVPRRRAVVGAGWLLVIGLLAAAVIGDRLAGGSLLPPPAASGAVDAVNTTLHTVGAGGMVLVAMDADLGTYPEIRGVVRAVLDDLARRNVSLAFVSVTAEGRAVAAAEHERLRAAGVPQEQLLDLGFVAGSEAALVRLTDDALAGGASGVLADAIAARGGGTGSFDLALLVGGTDVGPRTWVEQVGTRLPALPMVAIAPSFARPELEPYLRTGQLAGLLATVGDDADFVRRAGGEPAPGDRPAGGAALLAGMAVALVVIARQLLAAVPRLGARQPAAEEADEP